MTEQHPNPERYWRHRRRLAYTAMAALLTTLMAALFAPIQSATIPLLQSLAWAFSVIVIGYYGNNAIEAFTREKR